MFGRGTLALMVLKTLEIMGPQAWLWSGAPHQADEWRSAAVELRYAYPLCSSRRARGLHSLALGQF